MGKTLPMLYASMLMDKGPGLLIPPTTTIGNINIIFIPCILCIYVCIGHIRIFNQAQLSFFALMKKNEQY